MNMTCKHGINLTVIVKVAFRIVGRQGNYQIWVSWFHGELHRTVISCKYVNVSYQIQTNGTARFKLERESTS